jgi:hypothetical protein
MNHTDHEPLTVWRFIRRHFVRIVIGAVLVAMAYFAIRIYSTYQRQQRIAEMIRQLAEFEEPDSVTNLAPAEADTPLVSVMPAKADRTEGAIELVDLGLVLLRVDFDEPIDGNPNIFVSETEITNLMYAMYLSDTNQIRDDSTVEEASKQPTYSTASTIISIDDPSALWRGGAIPKMREDHPVSLVTIAEATTFCNWLTGRYQLDGTFRLPTEKEWLFAAFGSDRQYPWGDEKRDWTGKTTEPVKARPELKTPTGLYGMWGNVAELVLSPSDGYGGEIRDIYNPVITTRQGASFRQKSFGGKPIEPRQDYWGYAHAVDCRSDERGFRIVLVPKR